MFKDSNELKVLKTDLAYIHANFSFQSQSTMKLEKTTNLFSETIKEINNIQDKVNKTTGLKADVVKQKFH
jgi:alpha-D-ribose 1-methylphosphonate 5-triphosphate diphosphatase PhnM